MQLDESPAGNRLASHSLESTVPSPSPSLSFPSIAQAPLAGASKLVHLSARPEKQPPNPNLQML